MKSRRSLFSASRPSINNRPRPDSRRLRLEPLEERRLLAFNMGESMTGVYDCSLAWGDYDNDGDLDLALAGDTGSSPILRIYRYNGNGTFTSVSFAALMGAMEADHCSFVWGDYNNDGRLDLAMAGYVSGSGFGGGITRTYWNDATANTVPSAPAGLSETIAGSNVTLNWSAGKRYADAQCRTLL